MNAREFYYAVVRMRFAQRLQENMSCEGTRKSRIELEAIVDAEIKRVEEVLKRQAEQAQGKLL